MRYDQLGEQLTRFPERHLWFGAHWWVMKPRLAAQGFEFGPYVDEGARAALIRAAGGEDAAERAAMRHYVQHAGSLPNRRHVLPNGDATFVHDPDMTASAVL